MRLSSCIRMNKISLKRQADRAERLADGTVDEALKAILLQAAKEYRERAAAPADGTPRTHHPPTWRGLGDGRPEETRAYTGF